jgi:hypothetical protein
VVAQVLQQAAGVSVAPDVSFDMLDYILSLREGIMDAWGGILLAFKESPKGLPSLPLERINTLILSSNRVAALCRTDFHAFANDRSGSKSKRGPPTSFYGRYWV